MPEPETIHPKWLPPRVPWQSTALVWLLLDRYAGASFWLWFAGLLAIGFEWLYWCYAQSWRGRRPAWRREVCELEMRVDGLEPRPIIVDATPPAVAVRKRFCK